MHTHRFAGGIAAGLALCIGAVAAPDGARAHCDGLDGPVVKAAQRALDGADVDFVLIWVQEEDESEIRKAFEHTLAVRKLGPEAQKLADTYFFETLVRIHRAGERAPFTGLAPAGRDLGPAIPLADQALRTGDVEPLMKLITTETREGITQRFEQARKARDHPSTDVEAGRRYVEAYVTFIHYVERAYEAASRAAVGHFPENEHALQEHAR